MTYEQFMGALCLWREGRGCTPAALTGIWWVIQNRTKDKRFPSTIPGVILQPFQFSSFNPSDPSISKFPMDNGSLDWVAWGKCMDVVTSTLGGDPTNGATNYESCSPGELPEWADPSKMTVQIGPFRFYKL